MTEDEAKTKTCCGPQLMARAMMSNDGSLIYGCIGSECMAWRWTASFPLPDDPPSLRARYQGHCGLAGKP